MKWRGLYTNTEACLRSITASILHPMDSWSMLRWFHYSVPTDSWKNSFEVRGHVEKIPSLSSYRFLQHSLEILGHLGMIPSLSSFRFLQHFSEIRDHIEMIPLLSSYRFLKKFLWDSRPYWDDSITQFLQIPAAFLLHPTGFRSCDFEGQWRTLNLLSCSWSQFEKTFYFVTWCDVILMLEVANRRW